MHAAEQEADLVTGVLVGLPVGFRFAIKLEPVGLAFEPPERNIMSRKPRKPDEPLLVPFRAQSAWPVR